jgi:Sec-independent protein translocase protein TatA
MGKSLGSGMRGFKDALSGEESHAALSAVPAPVVAPVAAPVAVPLATQETEPTAQRVAV